VRLIDFIAEEAGRHAGEVQDFQGQVDRLQNAIEEATSRNNHIEVRPAISRTTSWSSENSWRPPARNWRRLPSSGRSRRWGWLRIGRPCGTSRYRPSSAN
jgi:hypothetical protein